MFNKCDLIPMKFSDGATFLGLVHYNDVKLKSQIFSYPFERDLIKKQIVCINSRDYNKSDRFIIASLNDYYKRISIVNEEERLLMIQNYNRLYSSWSRLNEAKQKQDRASMEQCYDSIFYQLYLLGYKMSNN